MFFRTKDVYKNVTLTVYKDGELVYSKKKVKMAPGEMEKVRIEKSILENAKCIHIGLESK